MNEPPSRKLLLRAADRPPEQSFGHPLNPNAEMCGVSLSRAVGLQRVGLHFIRIPPGKEANIYHSHLCEEEFFYVLEGRGIVEIDGEEHAIGPGDFIGFPTPAVPHQIRNPGDKDLVYLAGGESKDVEVAEFPREGKHLLRTGGKAVVVDSDQLKPFWRGEE